MVDDSTSDTPAAILLKQGDSPRVIASMPRELSTITGGSPLEVHISFRTYRHIVTRRATERSWHVEWVLRGLANAIARPTHVGRLDGRPGRWELVRKDDAQDVAVCVSIKCLDGETWVNSAFPLGRRSLEKHRRAGRLVLLEQLNDLLFMK